VKHTVDFEPVGRRAQAEDGEQLLNVARRAGVGLAAVCGGKGTCGRCVIQLVAGPISPPNSVESKFLTPDQLAAGYRLACQTMITGSLKVHIPPEALTTEQRLQIEGQALTVAVEPPVVSYELRLARPTEADLRSDARRVREALRQLGLADVQIDFAALRQMPTKLRENRWLVQADVRNTQGYEVVRLAMPGRPTLGFALDLGTTKLAGYLVRLDTGETLASGGAMNPQIAYGEDVMARITYAMQTPGGAETLQSAVVEGINRLIGLLCERARASPEDVVEAVVVGNTAMHHLFLRLPVEQLGLAPYVAAETQALDVKAREVGLRLAPGAYVHLLPNIAGFVGADHVAMLLATRLYEGEGAALGLDIGTNTEVALRAHGRVVTCSTASGPAFEGAHIQDGMRAAAGAIERLRIEGDQVLYQTIDDAPPVGLCGSGILDAVAELKRAGIIDRTGRMREHPLVRQGKNGLEFLLVPASRSGNGRDLTVSRADVGQIQLAKGAMRAGIETLLAETGLTAADLEEVIIAGAFGTYIDVQAALDIGMLPPVPKGRVRQVGNAAGVGARLALVSRRQRALAAEIARQVEYIELTAEKNFAERFAQAMYLDG